MEPNGPASLARAFRDTDFAVIVGVEHYPRLSGGGLKGAINDAEQFHEWLLDPEGGGIVREHARLVRSTAAPASPFQNEVDDAIFEILDAADRSGRARRLYFYFSGHGAMSAGDQGSDLALLLANWSHCFARLALSTDQYIGKLGSVGLFEEIAFFLDCCRTMTDHAVGLPPSITFRAKTSTLPPARTFIAYASETGRPAFEDPDTGQWRGTFTRCLLSILRRSTNGICASELKQALQREVQELHGSQRAHVIDGFHEESTFGQRAALPQMSTHRVAAQGDATLVDRSSPLIIDLDPEVRLTIYDSMDRACHRGRGGTHLQLAHGLYRLELERHGRIESILVDLDRATELYPAEPRIETPALITGAATSHEYYTEAAQRLSLHETCPPLGEPPHTSRLLVFLRRADRTSGPARLPSEPVTVHDLNGRRLAALMPDTSHVDHDAGYVAFSCRAAPGTYRLRAGRSRRDVAITIPAGRAARVFVADRGVVALDDLRVALVPIDRELDPSSAVSRAMEGVIAALKAPAETLPADARSLLPAALEEDLCFASAAAHLLWRARELAAFEAVMHGLERWIDELPDLAILARAWRGRSGRRRRVFRAPPLLRASLLMAMTRPEPEILETSPDGVVARAARAGYHDSIWCTWSDRRWDERWVEPTLDTLRGRQPTLDITSIATTLAIPVRSVEDTIVAIDATLPQTDGAPARLDDLRVPGYQLAEILGRGGQGTVFRARREADGANVALKIVPLSGGGERRMRVERELALMRRFEHRALLALGAHGALPGDAGIWIETELCRGSVLDLVAEADAPLSVEHACRLVLEALEGLAYLHRERVVHRDIKPGNLLVHTSGRIVIADLGLAKTLADTAPLSASGMPGGTARFAAPEQLINFKDARPASDVWSMAATLYFLLTLELPRAEYGDQSQLEAALENPVVPIHEHAPELPHAIASCIDRALSDEIAARPPDGGTFAQQLAAALDRARAHDPHR